MIFSEITKMLEAYAESAKKAENQAAKEELRRSTEEAINEEINNITSRAAAIMVEPVDPEFVDTFKILESINYKSKAEIDAIINKYGANYLSLRAVVSAYGSNERVIEFEQVNKAIQDVKSDCVGYLNGTCNFVQWDEKAGIVEAFINKKFLY